MTPISESSLSIGTATIVRAPRSAVAPPHQLNLLVGERPHLLPVDEDSTNQHIILEHWHADCGSRSAKLGCHTDHSILGGVGTVNDPFRAHGPIEQATWCPTWCRSSAQASPLSFGQFRRRPDF